MLGKGGIVRIDESDGGFGALHMLLRSSELEDSLIRPASLINETAVGES